MLSAMEYPHWLMVAGALLVVLGFIGFAFHKNKNPDPAEDNPKQTTSSDPFWSLLAFLHGLRAIRTAFVATTAISALLAAGEARAANGAYAVDAADISEVGSCKVESWISSATNTDFSAVANPSCVVDPFKPVELSLLTNRARSDGEWSTTIAPKTNLVPTGIGKFGFSFFAGGQFDARTGENLFAFALVPATLRLSETMRIN